MDNLLEKHPEFRDEADSFRSLIFSNDSERLFSMLSYRNSNMPRTAPTLWNTSSGAIIHDIFNELAARGRYIFSRNIYHSDYVGHALIFKTDFGKTYWVHDQSLAVRELNELGQYGLNSSIPLWHGNATNPSLAALVPQSAARNEIFFLNTDTGNMQGPLVTPGQSRIRAVDFFHSRAEGLALLHTGEVIVFNIFTPEILRTVRVLEGAPSEDARLMISSDDRKIIISSGTTLIAPVAFSLK